MPQTSVTERLEATLEAAPTALETGTRWEADCSVATSSFSDGWLSAVLDCTDLEGSATSLTLDVQLDEPAVITQLAEGETLALYWDEGEPGWGPWTMELSDDEGLVFGAQLYGYGSATMSELLVEFVSTCDVHNDNPNDAFVDAQGRLQAVGDETLPVEIGEFAELSAGEHDWRVHNLQASSGGNHGAIISFMLARL